MYKPKIKICIPCYLSTLYDISPAKKSVEALKIGDHSFDYQSYLQTGPCVSANRNYLVNNRMSDLIHQKLQGDFTHILFVDSDIEFSAKDIERLLSHNKRIVAGVYPRRSGVPGWEAWVFDDDGVNTGVVPEHTKGLQRIHGGAGLGFCLIENNVFEELEYPWFAEDVYKRGDRAEKRAEDGHFAFEALKAGIEYWIDCDTVLKHYDTKSKLEDVFMQEVRPQSQQAQPENINPDAIVGIAMKNINKSVAELTTLVDKLIKEILYKDLEIARLKQGK